MVRLTFRVLKIHASEEFLNTFHFGGAAFPWRYVLLDVKERRRIPYILANNPA